MKHPDLNDLFEECLAQLRSGASLEDVLARHQPWAEDLRPLLETALLAQPIRAQAAGLKVAQNRSRARFLGAAHQRRQPVKARGLRNLVSIRLPGAIALLAVLLFVSALGSGLGSASAVPGEALYPVKRVVEQAQMALTTRQSSRLELEESFDQRRADEAEELIHSGRSEEVTFAGYLWQDNELGWFVDQVRLILTPDQEVLARTLNGSYVEVEGEVRGEDGVEVSELKLRLFQLSGTLESIQPDRWIVSGIPVHIQLSTQVIGTPVKGQRVEITVLRMSDGQFLALSAKFKESTDSPLQPVIDENRAPSADDEETETTSPPEISEPTKTQNGKGGGDKEKTTQVSSTQEPTSDHSDSSDSTTTQGSDSEQTQTPDSDDHGKTPEPTKTPD